MFQIIKRIKSKRQPSLHLQIQALKTSLPHCATQVFRLDLLLKLIAVLSKTYLIRDEEHEISPMSKTE